MGEHDGHDNDPVLALEHKLTLQAPYTYGARWVRRCADRHGPRLLGLSTLPPSICRSRKPVAKTVVAPVYSRIVTQVTGRSRREPGYRQGRVGHEGAADAARRRNDLQ